MQKNNFIPFLKNISDKLTEKDIKHEIPFVYINKSEFDYINIIIPDTYSTYDISKFFNPSKITEKNNIISTEINNFTVNFIKTIQNKWQYNFYYYSWNILHNIIQVIYKKNFNLNYDKTGLKYKNIDVSYNLIDIFDYIGLDFKFVINGFLTEYSIYNYVMKSYYFNSEDFNLNIFKENDFMYKYNEKYYKNFIKYTKNIINDRLYDDQIVNDIDVFFKNDFLKKYLKLEIKNYEKSINKK